MTDLKIAKLKIRRQTDRRTTKPSFLTIDADWSSNLQQVELRLKNSETDNRRNAQRSIEAVKFSGDFYRSVQPVPWIARYFTYGGTRRSHVNDDWNSQERKLGEHRRPERSRSSRLNTNDARYLRTCDTAPDSNFSNVANSWNSENLPAKFPDTVHSTGRWYSVASLIAGSSNKVSVGSILERNFRGANKMEENETMISMVAMDSCYLRMRVATKKQRNTRGSPCRRRVGRSWQTGKLLVAMNRTNNRPPHLRCQQGKRGRH